MKKATQAKAKSHAPKLSLKDQEKKEEKPRERPPPKEKKEPLPPAAPGDLIGEFFVELEGDVPRNVLEDLHKEGKLLTVPRDPEGNLTSIGSLDHQEQYEDCKPCIFWFMRRCHKAIACNFCHFMHEGQKQKRIRPSKQTRLRRKRAQEKAEARGEAPSKDGLPGPESPYKMRPGVVEKAAIEDQSEKGGDDEEDDDDEDEDGDFSEEDDQQDEQDVGWEAAE